MAKQVFKKSAGGFLLLSGISVGWLPFIPGILLVLIGLELLGLREWTLNKLGLKRKKVELPIAEPEINVVN
jgi:hypothetical protein